MGVLGQETGGKSLQEEAGIYTWRLICQRSEEPPTPPSFLTLRGVRSREWMLVCPPAVAVVRRLVDLRLLLDGGVLAALSSAALWSRVTKFISELPLCAMCLPKSSTANVTVKPQTLNELANKSFIGNSLDLYYYL